MTRPLHLLQSYLLAISVGSGIAFLAALSHLSSLELSREHGNTEHIRPVKPQMPDASFLSKRSTKSDSKNNFSLKYRPWNCEEKQQEYRTLKSDDDPNLNAMHVRYVNKVPSTPPFYMSLSTPEYDPIRYKILQEKEGVYYERVLTKAFVNILTKSQSAPNARVLDVGSNQGWFSIISAAMGYHVDAFDPNPINVLRICESNWLNRWNEGVHVYNYGVSNAAEDAVPFVIPKINPGAASFRKGVDEVKDQEKYTYSNTSILTLDDFAEERGWLDENDDTDIVILKVDVESLEDMVFWGARRLLQSGRVKNILMELTVERRASVTRGRTLVKYLANRANFALKAYGYWMGPGNDVNNARGAEALQIIETKCFQATRTCNLWWTFL